MTTVITSKDPWTRIFHTTLYKFSSVAQKAVIERFWASSGCNGVRCTYDPLTSVFDIRCDEENGNNCLQTIAQVVSSYVAEVKGLQDAPITLMPEAAIGIEDVTDTDEEEEDEDGEDDDDAAAAASEEDNVTNVEGFESGPSKLTAGPRGTIGHKTQEISYWQPTNATMMNTLSQYLEELQIKTHCSMSITEDSLQIACFNDGTGNADSMKIATTRLRILERNLTRDPLVFHILSTVGDNESRILLQPLESSTDALLGRILVPPGWWPSDQVTDPKLLASSCIMRYYVFDYDRQAFVESKRSRKRPTLPKEMEGHNIFAGLKLRALSSNTVRILQEAQQAADELAEAQEMNLEGLSTQVSRSHAKEIDQWMRKIPANADDPLRDNYSANKRSHVSSERPTDPWPTRPSENNSPERQCVQVSPARGPIVTPSVWSYGKNSQLQVPTEQLGSTVDPTRPGRSSSKGLSRGKGRGAGLRPQTFGRGGTASNRGRTGLCHDKAEAKLAVKASTVNVRGGKSSRGGGESSNPYQVLLDLSDTDNDSTSSSIIPPPGFNDAFQEYDEDLLGGDPVVIDLKPPAYSNNTTETVQAFSENFSLAASKASVTLSRDDVLIDFDDDKDLFLGSFSSAIDAPIIDRLADEPVEERRYGRSTRHRAAGTRLKKTDTFASTAMQGLKDDFYGNCNRKSRVPYSVKPSPVQLAKSEGGRSQANSSSVTDGEQSSASCSPRLLSAFRATLEDSKFYRGHINARFQLGHILLKDVPKEFRSNELRLEPVQQALAQDVGFKQEYGSFTPCCTSSIRDVTYLIHKLEIVQDPIFVKAVWEISCRTTDERETKVIVDAKIDDEPYIVEDEDIIGAIYLHKPQQVFDARLLTTGMKRAPVSSDPVVMSLIDTLDTGDELHDNVSGLPSLAGKDNSSLFVQGVQLRYTARYRIPDTRHYVEFVRVYEAHEILRPKPPIILDPGYFKLVALTEEQLLASNSLWYEIEIGELEPPTVFRENIDLDLGCEASWKVEEVLDGSSLGEMERIVNKLIEMMDHVGIENIGVGVIIEEKRVEQAEREKQRLNEITAGGW